MPETRPSRLSLRSLPCGLLVLFALWVVPSAAQVVLRPGETKLGPPNLESGDNFGTAVALAGDVAVVGSPYSDGGEADEGRVYVYRRGSGGWGLESELVAADGEMGDRFGRAVAAVGEWVAVGAPREDEACSNCGAVYVFRRGSSGWQQHQKIPNPATQVFSNAFFGASVALDVAPAQDNPSEGFLTTLVVGAPDQSVELGKNDAKGAAFVFQLALDESAWSFRKGLSADSMNPSHLAAASDYGRAVDVSGDHCVATDPSYNSPWFQTGAAFSAQRSNIILEWVAGSTGIQAAAAAEKSLFGSAVAIDWDPFTNRVTTVVGARGDDERGAEAGAVHVFVDGVETKLLPERLASGDRLGTAVDLQGNLLVAAAAGDASFRGALYWFLRADPFSPFQPLGRQVPSDGKSLDRFGSDLAVEGFTVLVGAPFHDAAGVDAGAAYILELDRLELLFLDGFESGDVSAWN